jgi:putative permease
MEVIRDWFKRNMADPQVAILTSFLVVGTLVILFMGRILAPVLASVVLAYLMEGIIHALEKRRVPRLPAVLLVFSLFMAFLLVVLFGLVPMLSRQVVQMVQELPKMIAWAQKELLHLPERYPEFVSGEQLAGLFDVLGRELARWGQQVVSISMASLRGVLSVLVYVVLMPLLVFFFLKDKQKIIGWFGGLLPEDRRLTTEVWRDVDRQIGNYIRGKFWEILIVWAVTSWTFHLLGLDYAMLIGFFVGLSVLIPYVGATVMTLPVALMAYFQFEMTAGFLYVVVAYLVIQLLDGNLLAPLLLSGVVHLHPVAIIVAILVFGGIWGFWGVFFAIPLATLVQAVLRAWPRKPRSGGAGTAAGG